MHVVKKTLLPQRIPSLPLFVLTSIIDNMIDHTLELNQWNHVNALDVKEIMHQTRLHMIKFDKLGGLKQN
jgi:hypothetical protein